MSVQDTDVQKNTNAGATRRTKKPALKKTANFVTLLIFSSALFFGGWGIGSGRITFNRLEPNVSTSQLPAELDFDSIAELYEELKQNFDGELSEADLIDGLKSGLASATKDPYTEYFNEQASQDFEESLSGSFGGIGAELGKENDRLVIVAPIKDTPAEKAGLRAKDVIAAINDEVAVNLSISDAVEKIRGEAGSSVKLTIIRGETERLEFDIVRSQINIPSVTWKIEDGIGILEVARYWQDTAGLARKAAEEFKAAGVKGVVLDLRNNPGGSLDAAVDLSSLWLNNGSVILREKRGGETISTKTASGEALFKGSRTVVLINDGSASASEITAGALQDNKAATVIGTKSFGKGSVQQVIPLKSGGQVKVTIARWFTPNDKNIDKEGITPDQSVERTDSDIKAGTDPQMSAAKAFISQ